MDFAESRSKAGKNLPASERDSVRLSPAGQPEQKFPGQSGMAAPEASWLNVETFSGYTGFLRSDSDYSAA